MKIAEEVHFWNFAIPDGNCKNTAESARSGIPKSSMWHSLRGMDRGEKSLTHSNSRNNLRYERKNASFHRKRCGWMAEKVGFENWKCDFSELFDCKLIHIILIISWLKTRTAMLFRLMHYVCSSVAVKRISEARHFPCWFNWKMDRATSVY